MTSPPLLDRERVAKRVLLLSYHGFPTRVWKHGLKSRDTKAEMHPFPALSLCEERGSQSTGELECLPGDRVLTV
jgi:hypothetical protein